MEIEEIVLSFVLDTNVVSEARKGSRADTGVMSWLSSVAAEDLYLSVLVVGEIRQGIEGLRRRDSVRPITSRCGSRVCDDVMAAASCP